MPRKIARVPLAACAGGAALALLGAVASRAQDLEPRSYSNLPIGINFLLAGYSYAEGDVSVDASVPLEDVEVRSHSTLFAYARSLDLWGRSGKVDVILPYAWIHGQGVLAGDAQERDVSGLGDPRLRLSVNFWGAPALTPEEFASYQQDIILGASVQVTAPLGQYHDTKLLNVGTNRWTVKPELGISKALGPFTLELTGAVSFYTDNDDYLDGHTREQDPLFAGQAHMIYRWRYGIWLALDGTYYGGGRSRVDGVTNDDLQGSSRLGGTVALPVSRSHSLKLTGSTGVSARAGGEFDYVGIIWQYRWFGGLPEAFGLGKPGPGEQGASIGVPGRDGSEHVALPDRPRQRDHPNGGIP